MTTNAFIFSWDMYGIESIIPISRYEDWDQTQVFEILADKTQEPKPNPVNTIINNLLLRARFNSQRHYEIYAIDCTPDLTEDVWREHWRVDPQHCVNLIRAQGHKIFSDRLNQNKIVIV